MSAEVAPDRTEASSASPLGVVRPESVSCCIFVLTWMASWPAAAAFFEEAAAAAQLMYGVVVLLMTVGVHSEAFGLSIFIVKLDWGAREL